MYCVGIKYFGRLRTREKYKKHHLDTSDFFIPGVSEMLEMPFCDNIIHVQKLPKQQNTRDGI